MSCPSNANQGHYYPYHDAQPQPQSHLVDHHHLQGPGDQQLLLHGLDSTYPATLHAMPFTQASPQAGHNNQLMTYGYPSDPRHHAYAAPYYPHLGGTRMPTPFPSSPRPNTQQHHSVYNPQAIQYIPTPPQAVPGVYPNPNKSPFTTSPLAASTNSTSQPPVRYQCEVCGSTFSRPYDRKRHYESQHVENPPLHRCEFCSKDFARADSLKRHVDGGCDKMLASSSRR